MSFCNEDPAPVSIWTNSQGPMAFGNEGAFQSCENLPMQQMEPQGSFMRQASSGGMSGRQFSSNQMQYVGLEGSGAFNGCNYALQ
ncbi:hypothetical protein STCU_11229 [Strigomonas culicis]|uniref:Uncharacterized protein n=1 Tax=Strigomonas culicis TaxID=28005 RepID=S9V0Y5_9TRYP|nr:hypothetical protein STCU_11229 [Strigomonas culicis]|eukprot:EPY16470.1 hypothetical protein STCU_11229 [Strigomonas culicis]